MFWQRQFLPLMGPEERSFQRIQHGSDRLESLINGFSAGEGLGGRECQQPGGKAEIALPSHQPPRRRASLPHPPLGHKTGWRCPRGLQLFPREQPTHKVFKIYAPCITLCSSSPTSQTCPVGCLAPSLAVMSGEETGVGNPRL